MSGGIPFAKMSGAGNDFVVIRTEAAAALGAGLVSWVRRVCKRGLSVGADGVLVLGSAGANRVRVTFYNPDGSQAFCGNGCRCAARYARLHRFASARAVLVTSAGEIPAEVSGETVSLALQPPLIGESLTFDLPEGSFSGLRVSAGCPHVVLFVPDVDAAPLSRIAPPIRSDDRLGPEGANVDVVARKPDGSLAIRTWERGVEGETLSCGSGAVAAACAARIAGGGDVVRIVPRSGVPLTVRLEGPERAPLRAILEGDARLVFEGELPEEATTGFEDE